MLRTIPRVGCDLPVLGVNRVHVLKCKLGYKVWSPGLRMSMAECGHMRSA